MTKGIDGKTVDGMSISRIKRLIDTLKEETTQIVADELERIKNDPALAHLLQQQE